jgi:hypothetical protein
MLNVGIAITAEKPKWAREGQKWRGTGYGGADNGHL